MSIGISHSAALSPLGSTLSEHDTALRSGHSGLSFQHRFAEMIRGPLGEISWASLGIGDQFRKDADELLLAGSRFVLKDLFSKGAAKNPETIGLFVGTTTCGVSGFYAMNEEHQRSGIAVPDLLNPDMQQAFLAHRLADEFAIEGPVYTFSTSCVASSQALVMAYDALRMGWVDKALVLGVDVLNPTTLYGFQSLQLLDDDFCQPFTADRKGINLSEAIVGLVLERNPEHALLTIKGYAGLSEAYHMTQPTPQGVGMRRCMQLALDAAKVRADDIEHINPHATGTLLNDAAEMEAILSVFGHLSHTQATKRLSGHALGASGALEILLTALELKDKGLTYALKNSFGFGGANLSLVLQRGNL